MIKVASSETGHQSYLISSPNNRFVCTWTGWHLPFPGNAAFRSNDDYRIYRGQLREAIQNLSMSGYFYASYTIACQTRCDADVENVLFYNVGYSAFKAAATHSLRFEKIFDRGLTRTPFTFVPRAHARYEVQKPDLLFPYTQSRPIAWCGSVICKNRGEITDCAFLWKAFKSAVMTGAQPGSLRGKNFAIRITISAPVRYRINLAYAIKPIIDAFISALHNYRGDQLDDISRRLSVRLGDSPQVTSKLLIDERKAVLGPRRVPHIRAKGLQWSSADDLLIAGEILREYSQDDTPPDIRCQLFSV